MKEQYFDSHREWVSKASSWLTNHPQHGQFFKVILFDSEGKICLNGKDMKEAKYPVRWVWPDQNLFEAIEAAKPSPSTGSKCEAEQIESALRKHGHIVTVKHTLPKDSEAVRTREDISAEIIAKIQQDSCGSEIGIYDGSVVSRSIKLISDALRHERERK